MHKVALLCTEVSVLRKANKELLSMLSALGLGLFKDKII